MSKPDSTGYSPNLQNLVGQTFGRLTVVRLLSTKPCTRWICKCSCGEVKAIAAGNLRSGATSSCGCWGRELQPLRNKQHGLSSTATYRIWRHMIDRCESVSDHAFHRYGGRGIKVCRRWKTFENFFQDMGERPAGLSLERIKNHLGYSPSNCKWATDVEQARNKRNNRWLTADGRTQLLTDWAKELNSDMSLILKRLTRGWSVQDACTTTSKRSKE